MKNRVKDFISNWLFNKELFRIVKLIMLNFPKLIFVSIFFTVINIVNPILIIWIVKLIVDSLVEISKGNDTEGYLKSLITYILIWGGLNIVSTICNQVSDYCRNILGEKLVHFTSTKVIDTSLKLDLGYFENPEFHNLLSRASKQASIEPLVIVNTLLMFVQNICLALSYVVILVNYNIWFSIILTISMVPTLINQKKYSFQNYSMALYQTTTNRKMGYIYDLCNSREAFKDIRIFDMKNYLIESYNKYFRKIFSERAEFYKKKSIGASITLSISFFSFFMIYYFAVMDVVAKILTIGGFTFITSSFSSFQSSFATTVDSYSRLYEKKLFLQDLFKYIDLKPKIRGSKDKDRTNTTNENYIIKFTNVCFRYPNQTEFVLKNININIIEGEKVAIVGHNGAGKSTLAKILLRFYDPDNGNIYFKNKCIKEYEVEEYWKNFSVLFQDFYKFSFSFKENIYPDLYCDNKYNEIVCAAEQAGILERILKSENKFDTILGKEFGKYGELSGGEWQKLSLSRCLMKNCSIYILDEPSSSLDPIAEDQFYKSILNECNTNTIIFISHRLSSVVRADKIIFLENGKINGIGNHKELMTKNEKYKEYFNIQAEKYLTTETEIAQRIFNV